MEKNYDDEMDFILKELVKEYEQINKGVSFFSEDVPVSIRDKISQKVIEKFSLKEWELNLLYYTLLIDEYLKSIDPLIISLEGLVFINNGGYVVKKATIQKESLRLEAIQNDLNKYSYGLMLFTAIAAFGTLVAAWHFAIEVYKFYFE
jgi:hypothetical protein